MAGRYPLYDSPDADFEMAKDVYNILTEDEKDELAYNLAQDLGLLRKEILDKMLSRFQKVDSDYYKRVTYFLSKCQK